MRTPRRIGLDGLRVKVAIVSALAAVGAAESRARPRLRTTHRDIASKVLQLITSLPGFSATLEPVASMSGSQRSGLVRKTICQSADPGDKIVPSSRRRQAETPAGRDREEVHTWVVAWLLWSRLPDLSRSLP